MFAAHRSRGNLASFISSRTTLRTSTALALLVSGLLPACGANRFNSTENAALSDDTSADAGHQPASDSSAMPSTTASANSESTIASTRSESLVGASGSVDATAAPSVSGDPTTLTAPASDSTLTPTETTIAPTADTLSHGPETSTHEATHTTNVHTVTETSFSTDGETSAAPTTSDDEATFEFASSASDAGLDAGVDASVSAPPSTSNSSAGSSSSAAHDTNAPDASATDRDEDVTSAATDTSSAGGSTTIADRSSNGETSAPLVCRETRSLPGIVRDFSEAHPDMEPCDEVDCRAEPGIVETTLGADDKPVLSDTRDEDSTIQSAESFNQWFNDVDGVNVAVSFPLRIRTQRYLPPQKIGFDSANPPAGSPSGFGTDPRGFFPIDNLNDTTRPHNYSFTYEVTSFIEYTGGETLTVRGDDDIFVFINRQLVIDLGGIHLPQEATVELDELGLIPGNSYDLRLFFAERHVEQSNLYISTTARFMECTES